MVSASSSTTSATGTSAKVIESSWYSRSSHASSRRDEFSAVDWLDSGPAASAWARESSEYTALRPSESARMISTSARSQARLGLIVSTPSCSHLLRARVHPWPRHAPCPGSPVRGRAVEDPPP